MSTIDTAERKVLQQRRLAVTAVFFTNGAALALWFSSIPVLTSELGLSEARLGTALGAQGLGTVIFVVIGSLIATRFGTRLTMLVGAILFMLVLQYIGLGLTVSVIVPVIFLLGATNSFIDVSMNAHGSLVERGYRQEIMPSFHAAYNFGGFAGASIAAAAISATGGMQLNFTIAGVAMVAVLLIVWRMLGNLRPEEEPVPEGETKRLSVSSLVRNGPLLLLGVFVGLALFVENGMNGWSGVYLTDVVEANPSVAAMAFGAFQLAMAFGRLLGSPAIRLFGVGKTLAGGSLLGVLGVLLAVTWVSQTAAIVGFALIGLGLANLTPMFFTRAAAAVPVAPALGIAIANTVGYVGYIGGPLVLGLVAQAAGLKTAFLIILAALALTALGAKIIVTIRSSAEMGAEVQRSTESAH